MASYRDRLPDAGGSGAIVSIQRLTLQPTAAGTTNYTISPVDTTKTYLIVSYNLREEAKAIDALCSVRLVNSTTVRVYRPNGASAISTERPLMHIQIVTASNVTVQRGIASTFSIITISPVLLEKSHANTIGHTCNNADIGYVGTFLIASTLSSPTTVSTFAFNPIGIKDISWEVVSYV